MKVLTLAIGTSIALCAFGSVAAQTCGSPLPIQSNSTKSGDTCTAANTLPNYGSTPSPQSEIIYSYTSNGANATVSITKDNAGTGAWAPGILLSPSCDSSTNPVALGDVNNDMIVNTGNSPDGATMYIYVTSDPSGGAGDCGQYTVTVNGTLPVKLQSFSVQ